MTRRDPDKMTRFEQAIHVLIAGGYWRRALERSYHGGEVFVMRLRAADGSRVHGIGPAVFHKMDAAGLLERRECLSSSTWPQEWQWADRATVELNRLIRERNEAAA